MLLTNERKRRGWSQAELARRARMNPNTISLIESGRFQPYDSQLRKISEALGLPEGHAGGLLEPAPNHPLARSSDGAQAAHKDDGTRPSRKKDRARRDVIPDGLHNNS